MEEARKVVQNTIQQTGLPLKDFFHQNVLISSTKPHHLRCLLFNQVGITKDQLSEFERIVKGWVSNSRPAVSTFRQCASELCGVPERQFNQLGVMAKCIAIESAISWLYLELHGKETIKLFRGLRIPNRSPLRLHVEGKKAIQISRHSAESYSTSLFIARVFGRSIIRETVPSQYVLLFHKTNSSFLPYEHELVVFHSTDQDTLAIRSAKSFKEHFFSIFLGSTIYEVRD